MFTWHAHEKAVTALAFGPDGRFLVSAGADECVKVWDPITGAEQSCIPIRSPGGVSLPRRLHSSLHGLVVSKDARTAAVAYLDYELVFVDLESGEIIARRPHGQVLAVKPAPDGRSIFALLSNPQVIYEIDFSNELIDSAPWVDWDGHHCFAISPDASRIAVGTSMYLWPPDTLHARRMGVQLKNNLADDFAFSSDNSRLFALVGGKIVVYSLPHGYDGYFETKLKGHNGRITAMALTPDGRRLWTASHDATVKCWDTATLTLDRTYTFQTGGLDCLAVSPDGNVAAVGSGQKGTITLWDLG